MRWDLFAILMLLPWAATFGGSLMAARLRVEGKKGQGALLGLSLIHISRMYAGCSGGSVSFTRTAEYAPWGSLFPRSGFTEILKRGVKHAPRRKNRYYAGIRHP